MLSHAKYSGEFESFLSCLRPSLCVSMCLYHSDAFPALQSPHMFMLTP